MSRNPMFLPKIKASHDEANLIVARHMLAHPEDRIPAQLEWAARVVEKADAAKLARKGAE